MVTAWSPSRVSRARSSAGPLRMLWVALTLFAFVYAHGVSAEGTTAHLDPTTVTATTTTQAAHLHRHTAQNPPGEHHQGHHGPSHMAQECVPGQPQQPPALGAPNACASSGDGAPTALRTAGGPFSGVASAASPPSPPTRATVLRI
ncbi:hypothetical protein E2C00_16635 [Streptomyces sp. WAC05374]|uniref:hypothetical protein n=1 Tax=Streptomyces sp. WAC05374 TaxID=2487420 RepID=UPI000F88BFB8|nr:hypothetical protein [Streptomyces sp. WAC05374]RST12995.1 hypothetical protein EF905_21215 [Streptomyces sp. WAC05374]TDF54556.1 hypothetical protein E2C00_16635 [Streptomyces sp. WAC05374]TDF56191.1 hypothetical protein E2C02_12090 [Streptomyces sp. WAC05374]